MRFWRAGLPWAAIDPCINNNTFEYNTSDAAIEYFEDRTGHKWNSLMDPPNAIVQCPSCRQRLYVPWTRWDSQHAWTKTSSSKDAGFHGESVAAGFSDRKFEVQCQCGIVVDHELQRVQKFRKDIHSLRNLDVPMPGTILDDAGLYSYFRARKDFDYSHSFRHCKGTRFSKVLPFLVPEPSHRWTQQTPIY